MNSPPKNVVCGAGPSHVEIECSDESRLAKFRVQILCNLTDSVELCLHV